MSVSVAGVFNECICEVLPYIYLNSGFFFSFVVNIYFVTFIVLQSVEFHRFILKPFTFQFI